ncbi:hypothetical protein L7F22_021532 [Adiantum nelumboides]|nr:hypothetical protein [Adiantum nelumboides]
MAILGLFVDGIPLLGTSEYMLLQAIDCISREFPDTDKGSMTYFLGIEVIRDPTGYVDANRAGDDPRCFSTGGYVFTLAGGHISWQTKRQSSIASSSIEAEYVVAALASREALWIFELITELKLPFNVSTAPITLFCDNQSTIALAESPSFSSKLKHIKISFHFLKELVANGFIKLVYVPSARNWVDFLIKSVPATKQTASSHAPTLPPSPSPPHKQMRKMGMNYGRLGKDMLPPADAVELLLQLGVGSVRILDSDPDVLTALANTSLRVIISVNEEAITGLADSQESADQWVQTNLQHFYMSGTHIIGVNVGNEILSNQKESASWQQLVPAMQNIHSSIIQAGLGGLVTVSTSCAMDILGNSSLLSPSKASFREDIAESIMLPLLKFISDNSSALYLNLYPYRTWFDNQETFSLEFALFNGSGSAVEDGNFTYTNLLDLQLDSVWTAMAKLGFHKINLQITETGWPTAGADGASPGLASTYIERLVSKVLQDPSQGTPLLPGAYIPTYVFSLFDEDQRPGLAQEKHWGLFHPDGSEVYSVDLQNPVPMSPTPPYSPHSDHGTVRRMGVNYGRAADDLPPPKVAVALMKELGVGSVRIFDSDPDVLMALANTSLTVIIAAEIKDIDILANSKEGADLWVQTNIQPYYTAGTNIIGVDVGDELLSNPNLNATWLQLVPAMQNMRASITKAGLYAKIMVSTSCAMDVLLNSSSNPPSAATFRDDIADSVMKPLLEFLYDNSFPLFLNVFPYRAWLSGKEDQGSLKFALFDSSAPPLVDGAFTYTNLLDTQLDAIWVAMAKVGFPNVQIPITETGWPTLNAGASPNLASEYVGQLVAKMLADPPHGTPLHPGSYIQTYPFSLFNEDQRPGPIFEQNWGMLYPNGSRVYKFDLRPPLPFSEEGAAHWCVADPSADGDALQAALNTICNEDQHYCKDFTQKGDSCYEPNTLVEHASYAFNMNWQDKRPGVALATSMALLIVDPEYAGHGKCMFAYNPDAATVKSPLLPSRKYWCVASPDAPQASLQAALDYLCSSNSTINCEPLSVGKPCHNLTTVREHASYAINAYWQTTFAVNTTNCDFNSAAALTIVNPSHDSCIYVGVSDNPQADIAPALPPSM